MSEKLYYSMGEVAEMFDVNQSLLRHWESQFPILRPKRNKKGNRLFTPQDVEHLKQIYHLVKECGMTLEGAKRAMRGQRSGKGVSRDVELMERLQRIRALLVEVREELKGDGESVLADADAADTAADSVLPAGTRVPADGGACRDCAAGRDRLRAGFCRQIRGSICRRIRGSICRRIRGSICRRIRGSSRYRSGGRICRRPAPGGRRRFGPGGCRRTGDRNGFPEVQAVPASRKRGRKAVVRIDEATGQPLEEMPSDVLDSRVAPRANPAARRRRPSTRSCSPFYEQRRSSDGAPKTDLKPYGYEKIKDVNLGYRNLCPASLAGTYDNAGLVVGREDDEVQRCAAGRRCHGGGARRGRTAGLRPGHYTPSDRLSPAQALHSADAVQRCVERAIRRGIALYACHTNLDSAPGGMSWYLADMLGIGSLQLLQPSAEEGVGFGVVGELPEPVRTVDFLQRVRERLSVRVIRHSDIAAERVGPRRPLHRGRSFAHRRRPPRRCRALHYRRPQVQRLHDTR